MRFGKAAAARGLEEALAYARGEAKENAYRVHVPAVIDVRAMRTKLRMTQEEFAAGNRDHLKRNRFLFGR